MDQSKEYRKMLAEAFISILEEKDIAWKKEWKGVGNHPCNAVTGYKYRGINRFYLVLLSMRDNLADPRWATFMQIQKKGWHLRDAKGKGVKVEYWFPYSTKERKAVTWQEMEALGGSIGDGNYILRNRYAVVFNAKYIEGIPEQKAPVQNSITPDELIQLLSKNMEVPILYDGGDAAYYRPSEDTIHLPAPEVFLSAYAMNATAMHELAHATGASHRLNRGLHKYGSEAYAFEELIAEISSCFMSGHIGVEQTEQNINNHKGYVQSWIKEIREKPEKLVKAVQEAERATAYMEMKAGLIPSKEYDSISQSSEEISSPEKQQEVEVARRLPQSKELSMGGRRL